MAECAQLVANVPYSIDCFQKKNPVNTYWDPGPMPQPLSVITHPTTLPDDTAWQVLPFEPNQPPQAAWNNYYCCRASDNGSLTISWSFNLDQLQTANPSEMLQVWAYIPATPVSIPRTRFGVYTVYSGYNRVDTVDIFVSQNDYPGMWAPLGQPVEFYQTTLYSVELSNQTADGDTRYVVAHAVAWTLANANPPGT